MGCRGNRVFSLYIYTYEAVCTPKVSIKLLQYYSMVNNVPMTQLVNKDGP